MTLRVAILSRGPRLYSTRRLADEANALGCSVEILDPMKLSVTVGNDGRRILHEGGTLKSMPLSLELDIQLLNTVLPLLVSLSEWGLTLQTAAMESTTVETSCMQLRSSLQITYPFLQQHWFEIGAM